MAAEFVLNPAGIEELLKSPELAMDLHERVLAIADEAQRIAPVVSGGYRDSISAGTFDDGDRVTGYVRAGVDYACEVEVRHRTLGKALGAAERSG